MGRPPIIEDAATMETLADDFFAKCNRNRTRPTITGLAYHLGFESRQSFYDYEQREQFSYIVKRLRLFVESGYEEALSSNSCTGAIFALKNMGWRDRTEQEISGAVPVTINEQRTYEPAYDTKPTREPLQHK